MIKSDDYFSSKYFPRTLYRVVFAATFVAALGAPAHAVLVTETAFGTVTEAIAGNPFGVAVGDSVTGSATFDDSLIAPIGPGFIAIDSDPAFALSVTIGSRVFVESEDEGFGFGFPEISFLDGIADGVDFVVDPFDFGGFFGMALDVFGETFIIEDSSGVVVAGSFAAPTPIPEPISLALFGAGLVVLGLARRRARP